MKRLNKKGFTLIELLAVIIILGILMIIAIPSVTSYIQNSRKSAYVDTSVGYMDAVMKEVNGGKEFRLYSTSTLYMIPVGHIKGESCVTVESGGQSPFDDKWNYAFVGVTYDGKGYNYYYIGEDGAGQGIGMLDKKTLTDDGTDYIYSTYGSEATTTKKGENTISSDFSTYLKGKYTATANSSVTVSKHYDNTINSSCTDGTPTGNVCASDAEMTVLSKFVEEAEKKEGKVISSILYISPKICSQKEQATANTNP